jgi:hypothetical protein
VSRDRQIEVERLLRKVLANKQIEVRFDPTGDVGDVRLGEQLIAVLFNDDGKDRFAFQMAIVDRQPQPK